MVRGWHGNSSKDSMRNPARAAKRWKCKKDREGRKQCNEGKAARKARRLREDEKAAKATRQQESEDVRIQQR
jgi:hypothetical protein